MTKIYNFECYDNEDKTLTKVTFNTDNDCWCGYDGPMWKFFEFLKGCGFVFDINTQIGVVDGKDVFTSASED